MKKYIVAIILAIPIVSFGQIFLTDSATHTEISVYAGVLAGPKVAVDNAKVSAHYSLRSGGTIMYSPKRWVSIYGLGAGETAQTDTTTPFALFGGIIRPWKSVKIVGGKIASPMTELRPLPTTGAGQFEPWTKSHIPGSALGAKVQWSRAQHFSIVAGMFKRDTDVSNELGLQFSHIHVAGYMMQKTQRYGTALELDYPFLYAMLVYNQQENVGVLISIPVPKTTCLSIYTDLGWIPSSGSEWKWVRGEWGFLQTAHIRKIQTLEGIGYSWEKRSVNVYVFIHI